MVFTSILKVISEIIGPVSKIVDEVVTTKEEKLIVHNALETIKNEMTVKMLDYESKLTQAQADIVKSETVGSWLQRSWRPILMLLFGFILIYEYFIANVFGLPKSGLPDAFWQLLNIGIGGYVVGRSAEKIAPNFSNKANKNS